MLGNVGKAFLQEFIETFKSEIPLWQVKSDGYKNKTQKQKSWETLLTKYKEFDKYATMDTVKRKINALRTSYRREVRKFKQIGNEEIYKPTLWYFNSLSFLMDQEKEIEGEFKMEAFADGWEFETPNTSTKRAYSEVEFSQNADENLDYSKRQKTSDQAEIVVKNEIIMDETEVFGCNQTTTTEPEILRTNQKTRNEAEAFGYNQTTRTEPEVFDINQRTRDKTQIFGINRRTRTELEVFDKSQRTRDEAQAFGITQMTRTEPEVFDKNQRTRDEAEVFGEGWGMLYRKLSHEQQIFAKRLIDEALLQGQLGHLKYSSSIKIGEEL